MTDREWIQKGPCKLCGVTNYPLSMGGPDICPACDCYGVCPRCKILISENNRLKTALAELDKPVSRDEMAQIIYNFLVVQQGCGKSTGVTITENLAFNIADALLAKLNPPLGKEGEMR